MQCLSKINLKNLDSFEAQPKRVHHFYFSFSNLLNMSLHTLFILNPIRPKSILTPFCFYKVEAHVGKKISKIFAFCELKLKYSHFELKLHPGTFTDKNTIARQGTFFQNV